MKKKAIRYKFWTENRLEGYFEMTKEDLIPKFIEWMQTKEVEWLEYYGPSVALSFVSTQKGLNSVPDSTQVESLIELLKPELYKYIDEQNIGV